MAGCVLAVSGLAGSSRGGPDPRLRGDAGSALGRIRRRPRGQWMIVLGAEQRRQGRAQNLRPRELDLLFRRGRSWRLGRSRRRRLGRRRFGGLRAGPGGCAPLLCAAPEGWRRNHSGSLPSLRASAGLAVPVGSAAAGLLSSGASKSIKSSSCAAPLLGPFSAPASRADSKPSPSSLPVVSAGGSGTGLAGGRAAPRPDASPPSPDRLLRIDARISSRLLAPVASGLLITAPHSHAAAGVPVPTDPVRNDMAYALSAPASL